MNLKALRAFCLVMRHGSLALAAENLHLSPSAVSRLVSNLESTLGLTLFTRDRRTLQPTPQGHAFYREALRILSGIESLPLVAREIEAGIDSHLRVIAMSRLAFSLIAPAAKAFREIYPEIGLTIEMHHRRDMERWLAGRQFDLGFGPLPLEDANISLAPICAARAMAVFHPDHPLAKKDEVEVSDLIGEPLISLTFDTLLQGQIEAIFSASGMVPREAMRTSSSLLACRLVAEGLGYSITDSFVAMDAGPKIRAVPIKPAFMMEFGVLRPVGHPPLKASENFEGCVRKLAARMNHVTVFTD